MHADEYQVQLAQQMREDALQAQVLQAAGVLGWRCYHTKDSRGSQRGFPDLVLVRGGRLIFAELKRMPTTKSPARPTPDQQGWLDDLNRVAQSLGPVLVPDAGIEVYVWRPIDMIRDDILEVLR